MALDRGASQKEILRFLNFSEVRDLTIGQSCAEYFSAEVNVDGGGSSGNNSTF